MNEKREFFKFSIWMCACGGSLKSETQATSIEFDKAYALRR